MGCFFPFEWCFKYLKFCLKEYEVVEEDETNGEWEKELEDMLGEAPEAEPASKPTETTKTD